MNSLYRKYDVKITEFNISKIKKAYNLYLHQTVFDKILDGLIFFAIMFTLFEILGQFVFTFPQEIYHIMHMMTVLIITIFGLELLREYAVSNTRKEFFKKHWLDVTLVCFLSFYMFAGAYLGLAKIEKIVQLEKYAKETKHVKIVLRFFGIRIGE